MTAAAQPVTPAEAELRRLFAQRIAILEGPKGTMIQSRQLTEADCRGERFRRHPRDLKGDHDILCLPRRHQHLQRHAHFPGRLRDRAGRRRSEPGGRADRGPRRPLGSGPVPPAHLCRRHARPHQPHRLPLARRQPARLSRRHFRPARRRLLRAGQGSGRGRRRNPPARDHLRHPQRQGGPLCLRKPF